MKFNFITVSSLATTLITFGSLVGGANAATFLLDTTAADFADTFVNDGDAITVDGITMTFSNIQASDGSNFGVVDSSGIFLSGIIDPGFSDTVSFSFSFDQDVIISGYGIGQREDIPSGSFFTVSGSNGISTNNVIPEISGQTTTLFTAEPQDGIEPYLLAGEVYTFTHNLPNNTGLDANFNLAGIEVQTVPEPSSALLLSLAGIALIANRRRIQ